MGKAGRRAGWVPEGRGGGRGSWRGWNPESIRPGFCLRLTLSVTRPLPIPVHLSLGVLRWGPAGAEREVMVNMLNSLSRNQQLPRITPRCGCVDPLPGRLPFHGYESACSGRHYCLRGMDYYASGSPCTDRRLRPWCREQPTVRFAGLRPPQPGSTPHKPRPRTPPPSSPASFRAGPQPALAPRCTFSRPCRVPPSGSKA